MTVLQSLNLCVNQLLHTNQLQEAFELIPESRSYFQKDIEGKKKIGVSRLLIHVERMREDYFLF